MIIGRRIKEVKVLEKNKIFLKDKKGFTFVEIILVIAMLLILAGGVIIYMGHLRDVNVKRVVNEVDNTLDKLQVRTMSKAKTPYMYIYRLDDGCYMKVIEEKIDIFDSSKFDKNGTRLGAASIQIYKDNETEENKITGQKFIKIVYNKSSEFNYETGATNVLSIIFKGNSKYKIRLIKDTGKHIVE